MCPIKDFQQDSEKRAERFEIQYQVKKKPDCIKQQGFPDFVFYLNKGGFAALYWNNSIIGVTK